MPSLLLFITTLLRARINSAAMRVGRLSTDPVSVMLAHAGLSHCIAIMMTSRMDDHSLQSSPVNLGRQRDETVDAHLIDLPLFVALRRPLSSPIDRDCRAGVIN